ncbi:putative DDT domain-containing protein [Cocos nucifera]|uniref:Putative DDT domain-containing protein n=1 Tax=Cocos nucifera TaxID=13894 RepID=A0A8K0HZT2_COCNU|nr:putative DDT domain-containing protein [Cocos nucifera]
MEIDEPEQTTDSTATTLEPPRIRRLDESVVNRIAAGEVIQRPASAVKELVENSLDAGATSISVVVKDGGLKLIQVSDNGHGIRYEDLPILCERHTTSKLSTYEDLQTIKSMGFRGEALASMTYVGHVTVTTITEGQLHGYRVSYRDGVMENEPRPCAAVRGTQIMVENLFYNMIARRKTLQNSSDDYPKIIDLISRFAVHNISVSFSCRKHGANRADVHTVAACSRLDAIRTVYGVSVARDLMEITASDDNPVRSIFKMDGFISNANYVVKKTTMILFINDRLVECTALKRAIEVVYSATLPKASKPFIYMSIGLPSEHVDVNIHPTKREVSLLNQESLIETIQTAVESKLMNSNTSRTFQTQPTIFIWMLLSRRNAVRLRRNPKESADLTSIHVLLSDIDSNVHSGLLDIVKNCTYVGLADEVFALLQHNTHLYLMNVVSVSKKFVRTMQDMSCRTRRVLALGMHVCCDTFPLNGTLSLKDLVNEIYTKLQECLFEGLELHGRKEQSFCACKILKILDDGDTMQYKVGWVDNDKKVTDTSIIKAEDLIRKKPPFSRNILKVFIRESTSKSAPWLVHEKLAKQHGISTELPGELRDKLTIQNGKEHKNARRKNILNAGDNKINKKRKETENENLEGMDMIKKKLKKEEEKVKEKPVKYPIDDLLVQPAADDPVFADRPTPSTDFHVPVDCVGDLLIVWDFCSSFSRLLHLWPFSLEDFENAICYKDSDLMLIVELHSAIVRLLIKDESDYFMAIQNKKQKSKITLTNWTEYLCDFLEMEDRVELSSHVTTIKRGHYGLLDINIKLGILRELVSEVLSTDAVREKLDDCIEQQQVLAATRRAEARKKKEEQHLKREDTSVKEMDQGHIVENGKENSCISVLQRQTKKIHSSKNNHISENWGSKYDMSNSRETSNKMRKDDGGCTEKVKYLSGTKDNMKGQRRRKDKEKEELHLERELEKLSIRTTSLGKDRNYNRYWFFRHEGRLFVESSDHKQWGYYSTKEELDALMGSLNPKGERERALQRQLEKYYHRIRKSTDGNAWITKSFMLKIL